MLDSIQKFLLSSLWPWLNKHVLKKIQEKLIRIAIEIIIKLATDIMKEMYNKASSRVSDADKKSKEAEQNANNSTDINEAEKYKKEAEIWRTVAYSYMEDLNEMKKVFESTMEKTKDVLVDEMNKDIDINISDGKPVLYIGEYREELPKVSK